MQEKQKGHCAEANTVHTLVILSVRPFVCLSHSLYGKTTEHVSKLFHHLASGDERPSLLVLLITDAIFRWHHPQLVYNTRTHQEMR